MAVDETFRDLVGVELLVPRKTRDMPEKCSVSATSGLGRGEPGGVVALMKGGELEEDRSRCGIAGRRNLAPAQGERRPYARSIRCSPTLSKGLEL